MYSGQTVSYKSIIDKVLRDFPFDDKISDEEGLEWLAEFMAHTNSGVVMASKVGYIDIVDGRGILPSDLHKIKQCAEVQGSNLTLEDLECGKGHLIPMRWSTDNFHMRYHLDDRDYTTQSKNTYIVSNGFIFPSFDCGWVAMAYEAIPTDDCGYPVIPAEQQWVEAAAHYIGHRIARKMWLKNELTTEKYFMIERDKEWYFAQAVNHSKQWNGVDDAESWKNSLVRTIPSIQDHSNFFANMQIPEQRNFRSKAFTSNGSQHISVQSVPVNVPVGTTSNQVNYLPTLITGTATSITNTSASSTSNIMSYGNTAITNYGICYSTSSNPTIDDTIISLGATAQPLSYSVSLTGLTPNTTYYIRAFATHGTGTSYGNEVTFTTLP